MNKYYEIEKSRKSNCSYIGKIESENDVAVDSLVGFICTLIAFFTSEKVLTVVRVISTLACFVGFIGILGSVDAGTMSLGGGILLSLFMVFIEIVCFIPRKAEK